MGSSQSKKTKKIKDPIANGYFNYVNKLLLYYSLENNENIDNYAFSMRKLDFNNPNATSKKDNDYEIYWLDYFKDYLNIQIQKNIPWASPLLKSLQKESFIFEKAFQSAFFYGEFSINTKPECLNINPDLNESKAYSTNDKNNANSKDSNSDDIGEGKLQEDYTQMSILENLGGSIMSMNIDALDENDPQRNYSKLRKRVKKYVKEFKNQINDHSHPINIIIRHFSIIFTEHVYGIISTLNKLLGENLDEYHEKLKENAEAISKQLQKFIIKTHATLKLMYCKTLDYRCFSEEKDEVLNLVASQIFKTGKIYDCIYELYQMNMSDTIRDIEYKLYQLKDVSPEDLGLEIKFCLNYKTLEFQKKLLSEKNKTIDNGKVKLDEVQRITIINNINVKMDRLSRVSLNAPINFQFKYMEHKAKDPFAQNKPVNNTKDNTNNEDNGSVEEKPRVTINPSNTFRIKAQKRVSNMNTNIMAQQRKISGSIIDEKEDIEQEMNEYAYSSAVRLLKSAKKYRLPFEQMMVLASLSSEVTDCITNCWKELQNIISNSLLDIDGNVLITIYIFLIIKSQLSELVVNMKIIKTFISPTTRTTTMGYYCTLIDTSIALIRDAENADALIQNEQKKMGRLSMANDPFH